MIEYQDLLGFPRIPYKAGGRTPDEGFDCWGLVKFLLERAHGRPIPDFEYLAGTARTWARLIRGELQRPIYLASRHDVGAVLLIRNHPRHINHVGLIVEVGRFVHSLRGEGVCLEKMRFWTQRINHIVWWPPPIAS